MKTLSRTLAVVGSLALGLWAAMLVVAHLYQARETSRFADKPLSGTGVGGTSSPSEFAHGAKCAYPANGAVFGKLTIPRLGLSMIVLEGAGKRELMLGPGHIPGTALPGEDGNVGLAGHRDTFFRPLRFIRKGDAINLSVEEHQYQYRVVSTQIVEPGDVQVLYPSGQETLTLVTCYPFDFVGAAPKRFIIRATTALDSTKLVSTTKGLSRFSYGQLRKFDLNPC